MTIAVFAIWVSEAQAMSSGGGGTGGGGSSGGGGNSGGPGASGGGGDGGRDANPGQRGNDTVTRGRTDIVAPLGLVVADDVCTGGKYGKC